MTAATEGASPLTTPLTGLHQRLGARLVPFAGYLMPVQFEGIIAEHTHTRTHASLFDVSHMGQARLEGEGDAIATFLETLTPGNIKGLGVNRMRYSVLTNPQGGVIDDLMITRREHDFLIVWNASRKGVDFAWVGQHLPAGITLVDMPEQALLALQGPEAVQVLADNGLDASHLKFLQGMETTFAGVPVYITRSGYTGEDGFELSIPADRAEMVAETLLHHALVKPAGLGARDTLRLEAGLCLYGHDLDETTTPVEAGLSWVIGKSRRETGGFTGDNVILAQLKGTPPRRRIGLLSDGRAPVREGVELLDATGQVVGVVTSGTFSPTLQRPIAMAYVNEAAETYIVQRGGKDIALKPAPLPFVATKYAV